MVELIRLKKAFPYPEKFVASVKSFNNALVNVNAKPMADLLIAVPGMKLSRCEVENASDAEQLQFAVLMAERDNYHLASCAIA